MTEDELADALRDAIWLIPGDPEINDDALAIVRSYAADELDAAAQACENIGVPAQAAVFRARAASLRGR